ncbi:MAG: flagellin [Sulfurimonas sp.]|uniref:flagellin N-terminal helical domain-containing protein n=1 Tax=Sulfurimonas sp. TaxID=2022749 RepID=UPI003D13B20A
MGFRINTNIGAMDAHRNATMNNVGLDKSLASLSSGLRINKAADDASGMAIANSLKAQSTGLGQAISNANDGIGVAQTADGALEEYGNIINTIRTKAIQASSDGQNTDSRAAIQRDIDKLLEAADSIAKTTQFNGQNLLDGTFSNKAFHIGAYAGETVNISVSSTRTADIGNITAVDNNASNTTDGLATWAALTAGNISETSAGYVLKADELTVNGFDVSASLNTLSPNRVQDGRNLAAAITDATGLLADATTRLDGAAVAGATLSTTSTLSINGYSVDVAGKTFSAGDSDGALARAINDISDQSGVTAESIGGKLVLTANDGRNIAVGGSAASLTAAGLTNNVTTEAGATSAGTSTTADSLTIAEGELIINGVDMAGTYGDGGTSNNAGAKLLEAIKAISGLETSTLAAGAITLNVNNGDDLNIAGSDAATYGFTEGVTNTSQHGVVNIYSEEKVTIGGTDPASFGFAAGGYTPKDTGTALDSVDVTSRESAEVAILIADSALKNLDEIRSNIGSTQNQLESTIRNISVTKVNVSAAESQIRDVDFAAESANFAKHNILAQSGAYAMSQANAVQQNVLRLLQ